MNVIQAIFCSQYADLKERKRKTDKGRMNGLIMITIIFFIVMLALFTLIASLAKNTSIARDIHGINYIFGHSWIATKLPGLVGAAILFALVYALFGKKDFYNSTIDHFNSLSEEQQLQVKRKGSKALHKAIFIFMVSLFVSLVTLG